MPQPPCWQPAFGLVMSSSSRRTCRSGVSGGLEIVVLDPVDGQVHALSNRSSARRSSTGSIFRRYSADATASSTGSTSWRTSSGLRLDSTVRQRTATGPMPGDADAQLLRLGLAHGHVRDRVGMRVAAAHDLDGGPPRDAVVLDLEHEPPRAVAGEEVLDRLGALAAAARWSGHARRARSAARRDRRAAPRVPAARRGCRRRWRPGGPRRRRCGARPVRAPRRRSRPAPRRRPSRRSARRRRPCCSPSRPLRWSSSARAGLTRPAVISGNRIVPPANTVMSCPVAEELGGFFGGRWNERLGRHARDLGGARQDRYPAAVPFASIDELESALAGASYLPDRGLFDGALPRAQAREAAAARGRGRRREDGGREVDRVRARRAADSPAVLRGPRRRARGLRVELRPAAAPHPRGAGGNGRRGGALRTRVPDPSPAARGGRGRGRRRAADRRDRPGRRGVRGVPARGAVGLPGDDPRAGHDRREAPAVRDPDVEPHARAARRAQAALPLPLDRPSVDRAGDRDREAAHPRRPRAPGGRGGGVRRGAARPRPPEAVRASRRRSTGHGR